ncbi:hypothetical protein M413DRAFT_369930 [Hebeloma cylindrosporum]|uniref:Uncharacterized protein n=1 Tax=Hebeloma cylindrosporum TaxID=76867 RepID=A0A0C3BE22_HEBCY|nr:hypothetical protein M413DRAFT_369930 [Hebeloma cylindrosporum h7]
MDMRITIKYNHKKQHTFVVEASGSPQGSGLNISHSILSPLNHGGLLVLIVWASELRVGPDGVEAHLLW